MKSRKLMWMGIPIGLAAVFLGLSLKRPLPEVQASTPSVDEMTASTAMMDAPPTVPTPPTPPRVQRKRVHKPKVAAVAKAESEPQSVASSRTAPVEDKVSTGRWEKHELRPAEREIQGCCAKGREGVLLVGASWALGGSPRSSGAWQVGDAMTQTPLLHLK